MTAKVLTLKDIEALIDERLKHHSAQLTVSQRDTAQAVFREELPVILLDGLPAAVDEWRQRPLVVKLHELRKIKGLIDPQNKGLINDPSPKPYHYAGGAYSIYYAPPADFGVVNMKPVASGSATGIGVEQGDRKTVTVYPGFTVKLPTGIVMGVPNGYEGRLQTALQCGLTVVGGLQSVHQGDLSEVWVTLRNERNEKVTVQPGDTIALLSFAEVPDVFWQGVEDVLSCQAFGVEEIDRGVDAGVKL